MRKGPPLICQDIAAPLIISDQIAALPDDCHFHAAGLPVCRNILFRFTDQYVAKPACLPFRIDGQHAKIGDSVIDPHQLHATGNVHAIHGKQYYLVRIVEDFPQCRHIGSLPVQQIGFMCPAALGTVAAIGTFNKLMKGRDILLLGRADHDVSRAGVQVSLHKRTPSASIWSSPVKCPVTMTRFSTSSIGVRSIVRRYRIPPSALSTKPPASRTSKPVYSFAWVT